MKIQTTKTKKTTILIIVVIALLAVALIVGAVLLISSAVKTKQGKEIKDIVISGTPYKCEYLVGESFDPAGALVQVRTNDMHNTYFVDYKQLTFSGFDSSAANDALPVTISYQGFTVTFTVKVKEPEPTVPYLVSIEAKDLKTTYTLKKWNESGPSYNNSYLLCTYSDGRTETVWIQDSWATQREIMQAPGKSYVTIGYMGKSIVVEFTITE